METRVVLCLCALLQVTYGQVGSLCRANERLLSCGGCQRTCLEPALECRGVCRTGCYCDGDLVRNATGHCVRLEDCPPQPAAYKLDTTEPRPFDAKCPVNEEYRFCETCNRTCDNPNPICPAQCSRGCFCVDDLVRDKDGRCVKIDSCADRSINEIPRKPYTEKPIPYKMTCTAKQVYKDCENCEKTCSNPNPVCPAQCTRGCFCMEGLYRAPNGDCLELEKCPKAEELLGPAQELSVEDCDVDEEYFSCGSCEATCSEPWPECPARVCTRGCQCRPPLLRHRSGRCVTFDMCTPQKCQDSNEEYACRYGCEAWCDGRRCLRPRTCELGCHCQLGYLRDQRSGRCVEESQCPVRVDRLYTDDSNLTVM